MMDAEYFEQLITEEKLQTKIPETDMKTCLFSSTELIKEGLPQPVYESPSVSSPVSFPRTNSLEVGSFFSIVDTSWYFLFPS